MGGEENMHEKGGCSEVGASSDISIENQEYKPKQRYSERLFGNEARLRSMENDLRIVRNYIAKGMEQGYAVDNLIEGYLRLKQNYELGLEQLKQKTPPSISKQAERDKTEAEIQLAMGNAA